MSVRDALRSGNRRVAIRAALLAPFAALALAGAHARAESCAGAGSEPCPYTAVHVIGRRAEGVLRFPEAVALDGEGNIYVADQLSFVVQKFNAAGAFVTEWGSYGGAAGQFGPIGGLATDAAGDVYVLDSSHNRIEKFDSSGNYITAWGHTGTELGQFRFYSSLDPTIPPGGGVAVGGNYVYVADSGNNRIERFNLSGGEPLAWGTKGGAPGAFSYPRGVAANASEVIVADDDNHRVEKFSPDGAFEAEAGSQGSGPGQFGFPYGVSLDAAGDVYVADDINHRIVKLAPTLAFLGAWGGFGSATGQLAFPRALAADALGDTYVADTANDRVQEFDTAGNYLRTIGVSARAPGLMTLPSGVGSDPSGGLFVSDTLGNRVELFAAGGEALATVWNSAGTGGSGFRAPTGIAVDPRGSVYVADTGNARVVHVWGDGTFLSELGAGPFGAPELPGVDSVAVDPSTGWTWLADPNHNRVLAYGPEGTLRARVGAEGGNGAAGSGRGEFNHPAAVAVIPGVAVFVADRENDRIVRLSALGAFEEQWGSLGSGAGQLLAPSGVATDAAGHVLVLDGGNNRVEMFGPDGRLLARWGARGDAPGEFSQPQAIGVDCAGRVYVADTNNNRVQRFDVTLTAAPGCEAAGTWPPPLDVAPIVQLKLLRRAGVLARRALALSVSCERGCKVLARATLYARSRHGVRLIAAARSLSPATARTVRLRLSARGLQRMRKLLGRRRVFTAKVVLVAAGPTGRRTTVTRAFTVGR
jgi:tripartite motif-containing protein 71